MQVPIKARDLLPNRYRMAMPFAPCMTDLTYCCIAASLIARILESNSNRRFGIGRESRRSLTVPPGDEPRRVRV
jgi:hypothetical protein